jgi:hypothetical protein
MLNSSNLLHPTMEYTGASAFVWGPLLRPPLPLPPPPLLLLQK